MISSVSEFFGVFFVFANPLFFSCFLLYFSVRFVNFVFCCCVFCSGIALFFFTLNSFVFVLFVCVCVCVWFFWGICKIASCPS